KPSVIIDSNQAFSGGVDYTSTINVFDSNGLERELTLEFSRLDPPEDKSWNLVVRLDDTDTTALNGAGTTIQFNDDGQIINLDNDGDGKQTIDLAGVEWGNIFGTSDLTIDVTDITSYTDTFFRGLTERDGGPMGTRTSVKIDDYGVVTGVYSNGEEYALFKL